MKTSDFVHEMQQTSDIFGRQQGISVTFSGDQAYTDGKRINLPTLNLAGKMTNEQVQIFRGFVDHEAGHIRHSDMPRIIDFYKRCVNNDKEDLKDLHNFIEDVWMENRVSQEYIGSYKNLKTQNESLKKKELKSMEGVPKEILEEITPSSAGGAIKASNPMYFKEDSIFEEMRDKLNPKFKEWGEMWAEQAKNCKDSEECISLAKSIYKLLKEDPELENSEPEDFDPKSGEGEPEGEPGDVTEGEAGEGTGWGEGKAKGKGKPEDGPVTPADLVEAQMDEGGIGEMNGDLTGDTYLVMTTSGDISYKRGKPMPSRGNSWIQDVVDSTDLSEYTKVKSHIASNVSVMSSKLRRALLSKQQRDWDFGRQDGRLDTKRLVQAYQRVPTVYKQRTDREEADTAISILVDLSGSMGGTKSKVARDCAVAISECLEGSNMSFRVSGFSNNSMPEDYVSGRYHREERLDHSIYKDYEGAYRVCKASISQLNNCVGGNNSDYDFVAEELATLRRRPESRKVLFVLSDGHPACSGSSSSVEHCRLIKNMVQQAHRVEGIESVGIGIMSDAVERIYPNSVVVNDISELSGSAFGELSRILVGK